MFLQSVWTYAQDHWFIASIFVLVSFCLLVALAVKTGFNFWYLFVIAAAAIIAPATGYPLYFWPFLLGMTTAFAEIISKFDDEPMKALKTPPALFYHVLNGLIAVFALYLLALIAGTSLDFSGVTAMDQLKYAMTAGFGAMLLMRSKLFNIKVGADNVSFGPEQIINILFRFMESAIGRVRARARRDFIEKKLSNIKFDAVYDHSVMTLRRAVRTFSPDELGKCLEDLRSVMKRVSETQIKSYELGYVIYDKLGEDFVSDLFSNPPAKWLIRPPDPDEGKAGVLPNIINVEADNPARAMPFIGTKEELEPYMAYGTNMSSNRIRQRLNWMDPAGEESLAKTKPTRCVLQNFRLVFNRKTKSMPNEGLANIISETGSVVEGVLYQLRKTTMSFLENSEPGYHKIKVKVTVEGKETEASVFVADADKVGPEMPPNQADLTSMIEGAGEHQLSEAYLDKLKSFVPVPANVATTALGGNGGG